MSLRPLLVQDLATTEWNSNPRANGGEDARGCSWCLNLSPTHHPSYGWGLHGCVMSPDEEADTRQSISNLKREVAELKSEVALMRRVLDGFADTLRPRNLDAGQQRIDRFNGERHG